MPVNHCNITPNPPKRLNRHPGGSQTPLCNAFAGQFPAFEPETGMRTPPKPARRVQRAALAAAIKDPPSVPLGAH